MIAQGGDEEVLALMVVFVSLGGDGHGALLGTSFADSHAGHSADSQHAPSFLPLLLRQIASIRHIVHLIHDLSASPSAWTGNEASHRIKVDFSRREISEVAIIFILFLDDCYIYRGSARIF